MILLDKLIILYKVQQLLNITLNINKIIFYWFEIQIKFLFYLPTHWSYEILLYIDVCFLEFKSI